MTVCGRCPVCGCETSDYCCINCLCDEIKQLREENNRLSVENAGLKAQVDDLEHKLTLWEESPTDA